MRAPSLTTGLPALIAFISAIGCSSPDDSTDYSAVQQGLTSPLYGTVTYLGDIPSNKTTDWFQHAQGVALGLRGGQVNMFYSTNDRIYGREAQSSSQFGISQSMPAAHWEHGPSRVLTNLGMNHYGDLDFQHAAGADTVLVACEHKDRAFSVVASFVVGDPYMMMFHSYAILQGNGGSAPWIAASKADPSKIYSSPFNGNYVLRYHDSDPGPGFNLAAYDEARDKIFLVNSNYSKKTFSEIQGGEFNYGGRLFLLAHGPIPGVYGFELVTAPAGTSLAGKLVFRQFDHYPATVTAGRNEEFEGITLGLIDPPGANDRSHVHAVLNQDGDIFFKHWVVSQNTSHFTLR